LTTRKPSPENEFETLIQQSLSARVARQKPRHTVWWRIKMLMSTSWVHHVRHWRWSLVVQLAVVLMVVFISKNQFVLPSVSLERPSPGFTPTVWSPPVAVASVAVVVQPETQEMRLLKTSPRRTFHPYVMPTLPLNLPPTDVVRPSAAGYYLLPVPTVSPVELVAFVFLTAVEGGELQ